jgi:pantothenate kinase
VSLDAIDPYPWFLNKPLNLMVNDQPVNTRLTGTQWADYWRPFLARLLKLWLAQQPRRMIIAIAGPPGSGKSVLAEQLHWLAYRGTMHKDVRSEALPMDGFHFKNAYLESHFRKLPDGSTIPLSWVKGQPDTIDVANLRKHLKLLAARPEAMDWPGYSRYSHDTVPDKYRVHESANLVFVEGNYLLLDRGQFAGLPSLFDLRIYVDAPAPKILANLMERHISGGKSIEQAKDWVKRIDLPNARIAENTKAKADVIIERNHQDDISAVIWKGEGPHPAPAARPADAPAPETPPASPA